eukprot:GHVO01044611.1.p1 GENE.GHVO01044611.1~~GHVO01044611.1.p1  ORF type:complete len:524 (-),score=62.65 GHVO01044611.1:228-1799(-)
MGDCVSKATDNQSEKTTTKSASTMKDEKRKSQMTSAAQIQITQDGHSPVLIVSNENDRVNPTNASTSSRFNPTNAGSPPKDKDLRPLLMVSNPNIPASPTAEDEDPNESTNQRRRLSVSQSAAAPFIDDEVNIRGRMNVSSQVKSRHLSVGDGSPVASSEGGRLPASDDAFHDVTQDPEEPEEEAAQPIYNDARSRRLSVTGALPQQVQEESFDNKRQEVHGEDSSHDLDVLFQALGIGYACKKGLKPENPNQDDFFIFREDGYGLYGVFDGHGPYGHDVSNFVQTHLPGLLLAHPSFQDKPLEALKSSFLRVHSELAHSAHSHNFDCSLSGTTATVILHRSVSATKGKLYVAHVGDSRAVLGRLDDDDKIEAIDLTEDHKPNNEAEKARIHASGGQVKLLEGDVPHRVFLKNKLYPGLAMSRAIGDTVGTQAGVIAEPDVTEFDITEGRDKFLVICSDGVWEFMESQEAVNVVDHLGISQCDEAVKAVACESWNRWIDEESTVVDDITCQVIFLFPPPTTLP